ncbi:MAG TPA: SDR family NAD(P)-dependent oxidoreductase [Pyrinomonadaceae bacterium]|nr:SDR family NAD(P)-dependent oxidoreductase [Pyrinomonadaceae bacterium]
MVQDFAGRVVLITGASRGLGRATAERFLERGAQVAVNVRTPERAEALSNELRRNAHPAPGDIRSAPTVRALVADIVQRFGRLDILVNNAAIASATRIEQLSEDEWRATIDTNLTAAFFCIQAVVPAMKSQRHGRIINVSSLAGRSVSTLGGAHYTASKAGMLGLTRAAAKELGAHGITVNAVCPGLFDTELTHANATQERLEAVSQNFPIARLGKPEEVSELICFLASESAGYITGASFDINGGSLMI